MTRRGRVRVRDVRCPECDTPRGAACARTGERTPEGHHLPRVALAAEHTELKRQGVHW